MKSKGTLIILIVLFLLTASAAGVGFYYSKHRNVVVVPPEPEKGKVVYLYYLEDEKVDTMPSNITIDEEGNSITTDTYTYEKYSCTNDLTGEFNEEKWEFVPSTDVKDSTCSLYFVHSKYSVTLTVVNGSADENNPEYVLREGNGTFKITPDEGYEYKDSVCSDDKEVTWDDKSNSLLINAVTKDVMCKVNFSIKTLTAKITIVNGTGNTTIEVKYGESINTVVEANDGYEKPTIECSNKQTAIFENNKITIEKLTNNTDCKITFVPVPIVKYNLKVELPSQVTVISGSTLQEVESGKDGTFTLQNEENYTSTIDCGGITPSKVDDINSTTKKYTFLAITKDITCKVTATRIETEDESGE